MLDRGVVENSAQSARCKNVALLRKDVLARLECLDAKLLHGTLNRGWIDVGSNNSRAVSTATLRKFVAGSTKALNRNLQA